MKARDFIFLEEITVVTDNSGKKPLYKVVDLSTGTELGTYKIKQQARDKAGEARIDKAKVSAGDEITRNTTTSSDTDDNDKDKPKKLSTRIKDAGKTLLKTFTATVIGKITVTIISTAELMNDLDRYADAYELSGCNRQSKQVLAAQQMLVDNLTANLIAFFVSIPTTVGATLLLTRFLGALGPLGIGTAILGGLTGAGIAYVALQMSKDIGLMKSIANFLANTILTQNALDKLSFARCESIEESTVNKDTEEELKNRFKKFLQKEPKVREILVKAKSKAKAS